MTVSPSPPTLAEAVVTALAALELADNTVDAYRVGAANFAAFVGPDAPVTTLTNQTLAEYRQYLRSAYAVANTDDTRVRRPTAELYLAAARRVIQWLDVYEHLAEGVSFERMVAKEKAVHGVKREGYHRRDVDAEIAKALDYYVNIQLPEQRRGRLILLRNRALLQTLFDTACRVSEVLALRRADVLDGRAVRVRLTQTKGDKPRTVFIDKAKPLIAAYCAARDDGTGAPLFVSHGRGNGTALTRAHVERIVKDAAHGCDLLDNTSPHSFRHARAQQLLDNGMALEWVAAYLGHARVDTTRTIYAYKTNEDMLQDMVETYGRG